MARKNEIEHGKESKNEFKKLLIGIVEWKWENKEAKLNKTIASHKKKTVIISMTRQ